MKTRTVWGWLQSHFQSIAHRRSTGRHQRQRRPFLPVAADVEQLEDRALLTVTYHGGALLANVETQAVYLGSDWKNTASLQSQTATVDQFLSSIVQSTYMDALTQAGYNVGRGTSSAGAVDNISVDKTAGITDTQIHQDLQAMISSGQLQTPDANRLYVVYVEPGVVVHLGSSASNTSFLGYHGAFAGTDASGKAVDIHYALIPYPGAPNFSPGSQGFPSTFAEMTAVTSHELAEAITDPNVNYKALGWYDDQLNGEIGDLTRVTTTLNGYLVQEVVNKSDQPMNPNVVQTPPPPSSTLTAPVVAGTALSSTTAQLSWTAVSGAQGYRIYQIVGSQSVLLGTVSASTSAAKISGLTPGTKASFQVEAYNATTTADSQVVTVTMPSSQTLAAPHVTATSLSSTSALLTWNAVSGAQGYRVYWLNANNQRVLLGTVGSATTAVQITGLTPGTTAQFMVESFVGSVIADSPWVAVTTPFARPGNVAAAWAVQSVQTGLWNADGTQWYPWRSESRGLAK